VALLDCAIRRHRAPRHFVSDQGSQFTGEAFRARLSSLGIRQRFGAIGQYGSIAIVERLWRTAKQLLGVRRWRLVHPSDMRERLEATLAYYAYLKPHQGLGGAVPAEIAFLDPEGRLPLLVPKVA
jgi:putative transposase